MTIVKKVLIIVGLFLVWRLLLFVPFLFGNQYIPMKPDSTMYTLWAYARPYLPVSSFFLYPWANFDGVHYLTIAAEGTYEQAADGRFFPFYPLMIRTVASTLGAEPLFGIREFFSAFSVANLCFLGSLLLLYKLIRIDYSEKTALATILLLIVFPTSFFFGSTYSESLFLLLSVSIFYFLRKQYFLLAMLFSMLLVATRPVGIAIIPVVLYYTFKDDFQTIFITHKRISLFQLGVKLLLAAAIPTGLVMLAIYSQYNWGDWLYVLHSQQHVVNGRTEGITLFPQTIVRYIKILLTVSAHQIEFWISLLELVSFFFAVIFLYIGYRKKLFGGYLWYSLFSFLIPTQTGTFTGLPRYVMILFPLFIAFALTKNSFLKILYGVIGIGVLFFLAAFFSRGYYIS